MREGHLGLGSNVGDRRANLQAAVDALPAHGVEVLASSSVYETEPVGEVLDQPDFYNACLRIRTALRRRRCSTPARPSSASWAGSPAACATGRARSTSTCSCSARRRYRSERLTLPHEQVASRRFVLVAAARALARPGDPGRRAGRGRAGGAGGRRRRCAGWGSRWRCRRTSTAAVRGASDGWRGVADAAERPIVGAHRPSRRTFAHSRGRADVGTTSHSRRAVHAVARPPHRALGPPCRSDDRPRRADRAPG